VNAAIVGPMDSQPIRLTTYIIPRTKDLQDKASFPFAVLVNPDPPNFRPEHCSIDPCPQCGAYPAAGMPPSPDCLFCRAPVQSSPPEVPVDAEFALPPRPPPRTVFLVDASSVSRSNGFLSAVLAAFSAYPARNVAVLLISDQISFLLPHGVMGVLADLSDPVLPPSAFLDQLPDRIRPFPEPWDRGPDIVAALDLASMVVGPFGRVCLFLAGVPTGSISFSRVKVEAESAALRGPNFSKEFELIAKRLQQQHAVFDAFVEMLTSRLVDCATFGRLAVETGGRLKSVNASQAWCLSEAIAQFLRTEHAICQVRVSQGRLLPSLGARQHNPKSFQIAVPNCVVFPLQLPPNLHGPLVVQTVSVVGAGDLKIRVSTRILEVSDEIGLIFGHSECQSVLKYATSSLLSMFFLQKSPLSRMRTIMLAILKPLFESYRYHVSRSPNRLYNLVMPSSLKLLPKYALGIVKCTALVAGISMDERGYELFRLNEMMPEELVAVAYPHMADLCGFFRQNEALQPLVLAESQLASDRLVLLRDGFASFLWVGRQLDRELCMRVFGKPSSYTVERLEPLDTDENRKVHSLLVGNVRVFVEGRGLTPLFLDRLVEDGGQCQCSYLAWLSELNNVSLPANTSQAQR
jgi:hypothetical protein